MSQNENPQAKASSASIEQDAPESTLVIDMPEPTYNPETKTMNMSLWLTDVPELATDVLAQPPQGKITFAYNQSALNGCLKLETTTDEIHCKQDWLAVDFSISEVTEDLYKKIGVSKCFELSAKAVQNSFDPDIRERYSPKEEEQVDDILVIGLKIN